MGIGQSTHTIMNTLVVLVALVGCALAQVQETPEVAAAKAHFFAAYDAAAHASYAAPDIDVQYADNEHNVVIPHHGYYGYAGYGYAGFPYHGYPYGPVPADTPEVHAAKVAHFAAYNKVLAEHAAIDVAAPAEEGERKKRSLHYGHHGYYGYPRYHGYHGYHGHHSVRNYKV